MVHVAVAGCVHGELDRLYATVAAEVQRRRLTCPLVLCCGDFQCVRDEIDLASMACPKRYRRMGDFVRYHVGESVAPYLTLFVGGNHEASHYLAEVPLGGWVARHIYYLGRAGALRCASSGWRLAGLSGIYKDEDYRRAHDERVPFRDADQRSVYHVRERDARCLSEALLCCAPTTASTTPVCDVLLTHDWPRGVAAYGAVPTLLQRKPFLAEEVHAQRLGSPALQSILSQPRAPTVWCAAHMHCAYEAHTPWRTRFVALDKAQAKRPFLTFIDVGEALPATSADCLAALVMDASWLAAVRRRYTGEVSAATSPIALSALADRYAPDASPRNPHALARNPQTEYLLQHLGMQWHHLYTVAADDRLVGYAGD